MDQRTYEINRLSCLNGLLCETNKILTECLRIGLPTTNMGLSHSPFVPNVFGVPQMDPRFVDYPGFSHSGYDYRGGYPFGYNTPSISGWPTSPSTIAPTHVDPFVRERVGFSHTPTTPWTVSPYTAEIERQRFQALLARQQYEAMAGGWRPFGI